MIVYHGSTDVILAPMVHVGREKLDFGVGFYLTDIQLQAERWAKRVAASRRQVPLINIYEFDINRMSGTLRYKKFDGYDIDWLEFIVSNRKGGDNWESYDVIEGGVADDRVIDTVELYIGGYIQKETAIERLKHFAPNNQICITNQRVVGECLRYIETKTLN